MATLKILTSEPKAVDAGMQVVSYSRKSTKNSPVADADKYRAVIVPSYRLPTASFQNAVVKEEGSEEPELELEDAPEIFNAAIAEVFLSAASSILLDYCKANPTATEIDDSSFSYASVVARMEQQQTSQRLNSDQIAAWYDSSTTKAEAATRYGADPKGLSKQAALRTKFLAVASNNSGISPELATKMLSYISEKDTDNATCIAVSKKLEKLTQVTVDAEEL